MITADRLLALAKRMAPVQWHYRSKQREFFRKEGMRSDAMIVFLVPGKDVVNGGIMAILKHASATRSLPGVHHADVRVCTIPNGPTLFRFTRFLNDERVLNFRQILDVANELRWLHLNIPEVYLTTFLKAPDVARLRSLKNTQLSFNVMLQNIDFEPSRGDIERLGRMGHVTISTAHKAYACRETEERLGAPLSHWSVWVSAEKYRRAPYAEKEKLVIYSPDKCPEKKRVLAHLAAAMPDFHFREIRGVRYEEYLSLIARAKYSITFGEGLDAYLVEPIFSGSIACAVFNRRFFTNEYLHVPGVFASWTELMNGLPRLASYLNETTYQEMQSVQFEKISREYSYNEYTNNLERYYGRLMEAVSAGTQ